MTIRTRHYQSGPRPNFSTLEFRIHLLRQGLTMRSWSQMHGLHYPTVHRVLSGNIKGVRILGMGRRIVAALNEEMQGQRRKAG